MRTFAQKPKTTQQIKSAKPAIPGRAYFFSRISVHPRSSTKIQANLTANAPGDIYEQEAERVSEWVMRMPEPQLQHACSTGGGRPGCEEKEGGTVQTKPVGDQITPLARRQEAQEAERPVHAKAQGGISPVPADFESELDGLYGGGHPLSKATRDFFEPRFGWDFSNVRVHSNAHANQLARRVSAKAFTYGNNVVFGAGEYAPESPDGMRLLGHELTHVVQQSNLPTRAATAGMVQRFEIRTHGTAPHGWANVPDEEVARLARAQDIVFRVIHWRDCKAYFRDNTPGGTDSTAQELYNNVDLWKHPSQSRQLYGEAERPGSSIAYTQHAYDVGAWTLAGTFIHELMHNGGQADEETCENALHPCGRLPQVPVGERDAGGIAPVRPGLPFFMSEVRRMLGDPNYTFVDFVGPRAVGCLYGRIAVNSSHRFWQTAYTAQVRNLAEAAVDQCSRR